MLKTELSNQIHRDDQVVTSTPGHISQETDKQYEEIRLGKFKIKPVPQRYALCGMHAVIDGLHFTIFCEGMSEERKQLCSRWTI